MYLFFCIFYSFFAYAESFSYTKGDSTFDISVYFQPEAVYAKNVTWLDANDRDEFLYARHYLDLNFFYAYGKASYDYEVLRATVGIRNRTVWGNTPSVLITTSDTLKDIGVVTGRHRHGLFYNDFWIRELWLEVVLSDVFGLSFCNRHTLTLGAFPFELGRGISLGSAYPNFPLLVGVDVESAIDQYAFGAKLSGELIPYYLFYDLYSALFNNDTAEFEETTLSLRGHQWGHCCDTARGFGMVDFAVAARLRWELFGANKAKKVYFEPYILLHYDPELKVEFPADAKTTLVTVGVAGEWALGRWEGGFEWAFNRGGQKVSGIDRNELKLKNSRGTLELAYTEVEDTETHQNALVTPGNEKKILRSLRSEGENNQHIVPWLKNKPFRFQAPYEIHYKGFFFVADISYSVFKECLKIGATLGFASGDDDPRKKIHHLIVHNAFQRVVDFYGFIPINETYIGKRVISVFFLNGTGAVPRPIAFGSPVDPSSTLVTGFTNLVFTGASLDFFYKSEPRIWHTMVNTLFFWNEHCAEKEGKLMPSYLGVEINCIADIQIGKDCSFFITTAVFFPGTTYDFLKDLPLTSEQQEDKLSAVLPGVDPAYVINFGFKCTF
jgi:hypothetical protein